MIVVDDWLIMTIVMLMHLVLVMCHIGHLQMTVPLLKPLMLFFFCCKTTELVNF